MIKNMRENEKFEECSGSCKIIIHLKGAEKDPKFGLQCNNNSCLTLSHLFQARLVLLSLALMSTKS